MLNYLTQQQTHTTELFRSILRIRRVEEALAKRYIEQEMRCPMHLCIGQEAIAVGVCHGLEAKDMVFSNHRAHGHYLAKGGNLNAMISELYGRVTGCCGGRGGSMHLIDINAGFMGATPIVGGTIPLAVGAAWASAMKKSNQVTVVFFGDGCFEEGVMHESLNFAALHQLPVVFVCENNDFSVYTRLDERQPQRQIYRLAEAHGMNAFHGDGNKVEEVLSISTEAINKARSGLGPQFLEFTTYRWREHCGPYYDDDLGYRSPAEIATGKEGCPLDHYQARLIQREQIFQHEIEEYETAIAMEINDAFEFAFSSAKPSVAMAQEKVYG